LVIEHRLNHWLSNRTSCSRDCIHFRLSTVSCIMCHCCIFAREYSLLSLLPHYSQANCIQATGNKIVDLNMSIVYCVVQFSFHSHDPPQFLLLTLQLKGLSLIHIHNYESGSHQSHFQGKPICSPTLPNHWLLLISTLFSLHLSFWYYWEFLFVKIL